MTTPLLSVLRKFREFSCSESDKGTRFEKLMVRYLQTDPVYKDRFSGVWLWTDWKWREHTADQGIDIVAQEAATGDYVAIQCKCYAEDHTLSLQDVGTFFSTMNMMWNTEQGKVSFARGIIIATTNKWNDKILKTIDLQQKPCAKITLNDLETSGIDWEACAGSVDADLKVKPHYEPKKQQQEAIDDVLQKFQSADRGKLVMACGTGKTYTSLRIAEDMTGGKGTVLFMVPSIALLSQALRAWMEQAREPMHAIAICSDAKASRLDDEEDLTSNNLPAPACTSVDNITAQYGFWKEKGGLIVVFSTYQSIQVVSEAQHRKALPEFDLIICDEAHRTTGVSLKSEKSKNGYDESDFVRIHYNEHVAGKKRLYMTATPRIYSESNKKKAEDGGAIVASMDDENMYGREFHRLPFSKAVREGLLSDYKVLVLCVDEDLVRSKFHMFLKENGGEYEIEDMVKLVGCYNGLRKRLLHEVRAVQMQKNQDDDTPYDPSAPTNYNPNDEWEFLDKRPMRRAVAFTGKIATSKAVKKALTQMMDVLRDLNGQDVDFLECKIDHVDGTMNAQVRNNALSWLKNDTGANECRILTNARCLSEGVDVPSLDAVMFLSPQRSQVDIVQAVGRVMRTAPDKKYGYIILPIGIPRDKKPEDVLGDKSNKYATVWDVLQALRAHDDRFNAEINHIELNKNRGGRIKILDGGGEGGGHDHGGEGGLAGEGDEDFPSLFPEFPEWQDAIFARIVKKCGDRRYWEDWAKDIAKIAERQIATISKLLDEGNGKDEFKKFLKGLHYNINPAISREQAIEMLAQQVITRPVFDALFDSYPFAEQNPVSQTMNSMLKLVQENTSDEDTKSLQKFYDSVKERTKGIDNAAGKQKVVTELYDKFFKNAFPRMHEALGIVYTPVEIVDFIIRSVHHILKTEFDLPKGIGEHGIKILDPFTGTGTFLVRLIQSGLIRQRDLAFKYKNDLFASEIVLLAYYIACINIEETFHGVAKQKEYVPFEGICLTDTFRMDATGKNTLTEMFSDNAERVKRLVSNDIRVIIGNPPYSVGQKSANDDNQNQDYPELDDRIARTYAAGSNATNKNSLYDSYIRAFRWASDRIGKEGVIGFVTNGTFIDNNAMAGFRRSLMKEFAAVYCFNLRGAIRGKSGLTAKKEGQNVFDIMTGVCITILIKKKEHKGEAKLHYHDIGSCLTRAEKLNIIKEFADISSIPWAFPQMDEHGDWLNHRTDGYELFMPIGDKESKGKFDARAVFQIFSNGIKTNRDAWCYNSSKVSLAANIQRTIKQYSADLKAGKRTMDEELIKWSGVMEDCFKRGISLTYTESNLCQAAYRPFCKLNLYTSRELNERRYQMPKLFPTPKHTNVVIIVPGVGARQTFSTMIADLLPDLHMYSDGAQCFPLYWYEKRDAKENELGLDLEQRTGDYVRHHAVTDFALKQFKTVYNDPKITREDIFYYVYGLLHSPEYRSRFENDLKKELPRIPHVKDFWKFSKAGRALAELHLGYERAVPYPAKVEQTGGADFRITDKMRFAKKDGKPTKDTIIFNEATIIRDIPLEAYDYIVNGKSAIEWIMERYAVTKDKDSGIVNDPNLWCEEHNDPKYIINLLLSIITVSLETMRIVKSLPPMEIL